MITVRDVIKNHGPNRVLDNAALAVSQGEVAAVIGPSGSGKSTLLRCINALESFDQGEIVVGNLKLMPGTSNGNSMSFRRQLRRQIGMVFQQFHLFPHMNAFDNVLAGPRFALGLSRDAAEPLGRELLRQVGLADKMDSFPSQLSGGQQQRVAIARALAVKPQAILFDEPTSALDPRMAQEVFSVMRDLARSGQTMIVVTHSLSFARQAAHTIHLMNEGRIVESGPTAQFFDAPRHEATRAFLDQLMLA
jgi:ABC-type polar amino acid transport system ATPase subunit